MKAGLHAVGIAMCLMLAIALAMSISAETPVSVASGCLLAASIAGQTGVGGELAQPPGSRRILDDQQRLEQWAGYAEAKASGGIVYVAGDGTGDFNCDGTDDQVQINQALEHVAANEQLSTVHLKGPNTFVISDTIHVPGDTILQGDATAVVHVIAHEKAMWPPYRAMIECRDDGARNIIIRGFEILGNRASFSSDRHYYSICLFNAYDVSVHDMHIHDASGDGIKFQHTTRTFTGTTPDPAAGEWAQIGEQKLRDFRQLQERRGRSVNSHFYNNRIETVGHDGIYILSVEDFAVHGNYIYNCRTNSTIRLTSCDNYAIYDNVLRGDPARGFSGNAGVQVQNGGAEVDNGEIYGNRISRMGLGGIVIYGRGSFGTQTGFRVHHNRIDDCNIAGIRIFGVHDTIIENNVLYANHGDGIVYYWVYSPKRGRRPGPPPDGQMYTTVVRNNIIANTLPGPGPDSAWGRAGRTTPVSGFGINNYIGALNPGDAHSEMSLEGTHQFISVHNCIHNNVSGPYNNVSSETDIYEDPMFIDAENSDFHLAPDSPCIGAGTDGTNIGAY